MALHAGDQTAVAAAYPAQERHFAQLAAEQRFSPPGGTPVYVGPGPMGGSNYLLMPPSGPCSDDNCIHNLVASGRCDAVPGCQAQWEWFSEGRSLSRPAHEYLPDAQLAIALGGAVLGLGRAVEGLPGAEAATSGTVWDSIAATQSNYLGTDLPRSFTLAVDGTSIWVHGNATEHIAEYLAGLASRGATQAQIDIATQAQLTSLRAAVSAATDQGLVYNDVVDVGGWELIFRAPRVPGQLPALTHALYTGASQ